MHRALLPFVILVSAVAMPAGADEHYTLITDVRVAMDDGVVMAADVYVPTVADGNGNGLYPCVVELTPYRKEGRAAEGASFLPGEGIALIEVDARGTGGSAGEYDVVFSVREQADAAAWVEWAALDARKPDGSKLCEEEVGMYGGSYSGIIQYLVATLPPAAIGDVPAAPPHLAAIAPQRAYGDLYRDIVYHGGQLIGSFGLAWSAATTALYTQPPTDVQTEPGTAAWLDHLTKNDPMMLHYIEAPYADGAYTSNDSDPAYTQDLYEDSSALGRMENLRVPTLHLAGFFDTFTRGQLLTFSEAHAQEAEGARGPNYIIAGPWNHGDTHFITPDQGFRDHLARWYLHWLEGAAAPAWVTDGFDGAGARALYFDTTSGLVNGDTAADGAWRTSATWPPEVSPGRLHLSAGLLPTEGRLGSPGPDFSAPWLSNPAAGVAETGSRWDNALAGAVPHTQLDQRLETGKGVTFTTAPLDDALSIAGPINLHLKASVTGLDMAEEHLDGTDGLAQLLPPYLDTDFVVKLSDVAPDGSARLVTQGYLRASHHEYDSDRSSYIDDELMSPYHLHTHAALDPPTAGEVRAYEIEIWPIAKTFPAGHALRLDIYSADTPNHLTLLRPTLNAVRGGSYLSLPLVD